VRFSKISEENAKNLVSELVEKAEIDEELAVQITNSLPKSVGELRTFLGRRRIISEESINLIIKLIKKFGTD
jgi:DNA-directed RNA polymerase subunit F